jgi:hydroxymethylglutaryl-CoA synthase
MPGIVSYGAYVPRYRIDRKTIYKAAGWLNPAALTPGERAVGNFDEDSVTMAVAAACDCLNGSDRDRVDSLYFASGTAPYIERSSSEIIATAVDLPSSLRTTDLGGAPKAGVTAVLAALDAVSAGTASTALVCAADMREAKAGSPQEAMFGDAAAAVQIGRKETIADLLGACSVSYDFPDRWRAAGESYEHQWEDRFIRDEAYSKFVVQTLKGLLDKCGVEPSQVAKVSYPCLYGADFMKIAKMVGLEPSQVVEPLSTQVGYAGTADPLLHLVRALEQAESGDRIAMVGFGSGADSVMFQATDRITEARSRHRGVAAHLAARRELTSYEKMITWRGLMPVERGIRGATVAFTAMSALWRDRRLILGLCGSRCLACGTPHYPAQRICADPQCGELDKMEPYRFSDKKAHLFTYTTDHLAFSLNPPASYGVLDFTGGGRFWFDITDANGDEIEVGMSVEMSFRKKYVDEKFGVHGYFWKAVPELRTAGNSCGGRHHG